MGACAGFGRFHFDRPATDRAGKSNTFSLVTKYQLPLAAFRGEDISMDTAQMSSRSAPDVRQQAASRSFLPALGAWCLILLLAALAIFELKAPDALPATSPQSDFSAERALMHVRAIAREPHPIGSNANAAAREYLVAQLSRLEMQPQITTAIGVSDRYGALIAGNTHDIIARLPGTANSGAIMLMAHYDSVPSGPGAADDGSGVGAILETVRALKTGPPLKNDLIVLITDGEESGLLGAEAFVASNPWMKDVGLLMNFEARGNCGASLLFETSVNNAALINQVAHAAPYPVGSSLFYAIYKLLPNDTDFTVFRPARTPGLNFAFGGHLEAYHSWLDTADNLDLKSLQHHGSYALALVRQFDQMDLNKLRQSAGDEVFFDWFGSNLIVYSESRVVIGEVVATILLVAAIVLSMRRAGIRPGKLVLSMIFCLVLLLVIPAVMTVAAWLLLLLVRGRMLVGDTPANSFLLVSLSVLGAAIGSAILAKLRKHFDLQELSLAGLVVVCILNWIVALLLPAGSYLLFWPLLLTGAGLLLLELTRTRSPRVQLMGTLVGALATILLFAPIAYLLYIFLTLNLMSVAAIGLLIGLFFIICIPLMNVAVPQRPWRTILLPLFAGAAVCLGIGITQSHSSTQHPREDNLLYSLNSDDHAAVWISTDDALDAYTAQFFAGTIPNRHPIPNFLTGSHRQVLSAQAPVADLQPPISEVEADEQEGDLHKIRMNVRSQRDAYLMVVRFDPSVKLVSVNISGRNLSPGLDSSDPILLYGMGTQGANLELKVKAPSGVTFWLSDYSVDLPTTQRRSADIIAEPGSDQTLVGRKYTLESAK